MLQNYWQETGTAIVIFCPKKVIFTLLQELAWSKNTEDYISAAFSIIAVIRPFVK